MEKDDSIGTSGALSARTICLCGEYLFRQMVEPLFDAHTHPSMAQISTDPNVLSREGG